MRFVSGPEAASFFRRLGVRPRGLLAGSRAASRFKTLHLYYRSRLATAAQVAAALAKELGDFTICMVWASDLVWGDRSSDEDAPGDWVDYRRWRERQGETRSLYDAPGHVFEAGEREPLAHLIELAIYMGWDTLIGTKPGKPLIELTHHDCITIHARARPTVLISQLERLGVRAP